MQSVVVIPSRFSSSRFPGKPLVQIQGISLLERTYRQACACHDVDTVIIATDDLRIKEHADSFGADVVMTGNSATGTDRIALVLQQRPELMEAKAIVNVQGDEPCINPQHISLVIQALHSSQSDMSTLSTPLANMEDLQNTNIVKCVVSQKNLALYFSRQAIPGSKTPHGNLDLYKRHVGLYAFTPSFVHCYASLPRTPLESIEDLEMLRALEHGYTIAVAHVAQYAPDVNTPEDIKEVERWINQSFYS